VNHGPDACARVGVRERFTLCTTGVLTCEGIAFGFAIDANLFGKLKACCVVKAVDGQHVLFSGNQIVEQVFTAALQNPRSAHFEYLKRVRLVGALNTTPIVGVASSGTDQRLHMPQWQAW